MRSWAIGVFGLRLNFSLGERRVQADFQMSRAEHLLMAREHLDAAAKLAAAGFDEHTRPDGY